MLPRGNGRLLSVLALCALAVPAADGPVEPLTVCETLKELSVNEGKVLAVLGRFSSRQDGRTLNEETCSEKANSIRLNEDVKLGPKPPQVFELDGVAVTRKLKQVKEHTSLHTFRIGSPDYDRWAVVYGRLEVEKNAAVRLVYRGDGVVVFLHDN
jgi:hypothetical protein